jgi:hypothetical protein
MYNLAETLDKYLPDIRSIPKSVLAFEPFILRFDYISGVGYPNNNNIPVNVRIVVDEIVMTSVMRWKGGTTISLLQYPFMNLSYKTFDNVLLSQTFPTNSQAGGVPVVESNSQYVSATQKLQFSRLPFIAEANTNFIFSWFNAIWSASLQADFTCNITINARQIF